MSLGEVQITAGKAVVAEEVGPGPPLVRARRGPPGRGPVWSPRAGAAARVASWISATTRPALRILASSSGPSARSLRIALPDRDSAVAADGSAGRAPADPAVRRR